MFNDIIKKISENKIYSLGAYIISLFLPNLNKIKKYKNMLLTSYNINAKKIIIQNNPISIRIAPISICNYKCLFCEIHKDDLLYPKRPRNIFTINNLKNYESFISSAQNISFYGGSAEPLLNHDFGEIVTYLKKKYNPSLMVNTNASMLHRKLADIFVRFGFDRILVSYHAGTKDSYNYLTSGYGNINIVDKNLKYLVRRRMIFKKPIIDFNFALQKLNAKEFKSILDKARSFQINKVLITKYYGGRNKLQGKKVSFEYDYKNGNIILDKIYNYAKKNNLNLIPKKPIYWNKKDEKIKWNPENYNSSKKCFLAWSNLQFDPVLDEKNSHYVSICNRIILFKINYDKLKLSSQNDFNKLWNHSLLQYIRRTVNLTKPNPICKYCKNYERESLRNIDANKYAEVRDKAVNNFFLEFKRNHNYDEIIGLKILGSNPYSDRKFRNKLIKVKKLNSFSDVQNEN